MDYYEEKDIVDIDVEWKCTVEVIEKAICCLQKGDFSQPIKPYLRFGNPQNRIIAMPAYIGNPFNIAGIKWIASFPDNIYKGIQRAHSMIVLNDIETGIPICVFNSVKLSIIRTASVSGVILKRYISKRDRVVGIIGWGPIGQNHLLMCEAISGKLINQYRIFDIRGIHINTLPEHIAHKIVICNCWQDAYRDCDIVITCTVSKERYIDESPKQGALLFNVSLRDYKLEVYDDVKEGIIVDSWDEVCRENTDIENFFSKKGLYKEMTSSIVDVVMDARTKRRYDNKTIMFNPMGMAVFDMAIGKYYYEKLKERKVME